MRGSVAAGSEPAAWQLGSRGLGDWWRETREMVCQASELRKSPPEDLVNLAPGHRRRPLPARGQAHPQHIRSRCDANCRPEALCCFTMLMQLGTDQTI